MKARKRLPSGFCKALAALFLVAGCAAPVKFVHETVLLAEPATLPCRMTPRSDLIEVSGCRLVFDLSDVPEESGLPLIQYNPFDPNTNGRAKSALIPVRKILLQVLTDGSAQAFPGDETIAETIVRLVPVQLDFTREGASVRCSLSITAHLLGETIPGLHAERTARWTDSTTIPNAVYAAAAELGDRLFDAIAHSRLIRDKMLANQISHGTPPVAVSWTFGTIADNCFFGAVDVDRGSWDMARVQRWTRSQIEQAALAKLGVKSLDNYRILVDGGSDAPTGTRTSFRFRVFPYRGFELSYDDRTLRGTCTADIAYLGISETDAYERAKRFIETVLSDQGVVKTIGVKTAPAQYRFHGYRSTGNGTVIEVPFKLVN